MTLNYLHKKNAAKDYGKFASFINLIFVFGGCQEAAIVLREPNYFLAIRYILVVLSFDNSMSRDVDRKLARYN